MLRLLSRLIALMPSQRVGDPLPSGDPADPQPPDPTPTPAPPADPTPPPEDELARLRRENQELQSRFERGVREEAERFLSEQMFEPEPQPSPWQQPPQQYQPPPAEPETVEERMDRLERELQDRSERDESRQLVSDLERVKATRYPEMDVRWVLSQIARSGGRVNIERACEFSHQSAIDAFERRVEQSLSDPTFRSRIEERLRGTGGGSPAGSTNPPAASGATPPLLPGSGPTPSGAQPVTLKNSRQMFRELLRSGSGRQ